MTSMSSSYGQADWPAAQPTPCAALLPLRPARLPRLRIRVRVALPASRRCPSALG
jgi:hypothetical protein